MVTNGILLDDGQLMCVPGGHFWPTIPDLFLTFLLKCSNSFPPPGVTADDCDQWITIMSHISMISG